MATNLDRIIQMIKTLGKVEEEGAVAITNNISGGNIAGAPPDHPPVRKKKKRYIYAKNTRKNWTVG
tara:strand:- start:510 stop:707 length:198 start_codon:yes stop_codon:yes gene_type:complete